MRVSHEACMKQSWWGQEQTSRGNHDVQWRAYLLCRGVEALRIGRLDTDYEGLNHLQRERRK